MLIKKSKQGDFGMLIIYGEAIWHLPEGDFVYGGVINTRELEYNLTP